MVKQFRIGLTNKHLFPSKKKKRTLGRNDKDIVYLRAKGKCEGCGKKISQPEMQVGHKKAYSKGGATTLANSCCLCYTCNKLQGTGSLDTLRKKLAGTYGKREKKPIKKNPTKKRSDLFGMKPIQIPKFKF